MNQVSYRHWVQIALMAILSLGFSSYANAKAQTQALGDFHMTLYQGAYGEVSDFELFTKQAANEIFFGISCSDRTPFPLLQVLLFNQHVLLDDPAEIAVNYAFPEQSDHQSQLLTERVALKGVLRSIKTAGENSNKIRLELDTGHFKSMNAMAAAYTQLLNQLKFASSVAITFKDVRFGEKRYIFSLKGLEALIKPHEGVCH